MCINLLVKQAIPKPPISNNKLLKLGQLMLKFLKQCSQLMASLTTKQPTNTEQIAALLQIENIARLKRWHLPVL